MGIFLTGATGFIGRRVVEALQDQDLLILVRPQSIAKAVQFFEKYPNVHIVSGDLKDPDVLSKQSDLKLINHRVTRILHLAATYDMEANASTNYLNNVVGMQNLLSLSNKMEKVSSFHLASTVAIAGNHSGLMHEDMFNVGQGFPDPYSRTKFREEGLLGSFDADYRKFVYRIGIVIGDQYDGKIDKVDGPYYLLRSFMRHHKMWDSYLSLPRVLLPFRKKTILPLVPVNSVVDALVRSLNNPASFEGRFRTYHLTGPGIPITEFLELAIRHFFGKNAHLIGVPQSLMPRMVFDWLKIPSATLNYMYSKTVFTSRNFKEDFKDFQIPHFSEYSREIFDYAKKELFR